jgi:hypothetical protein
MFSEILLNLFSNSRIDSKFIVTSVSSSMELASESDMLNRSSGYSKSETVRSAPCSLILLLATCISSIYSVISFSSCVPISSMRFGFLFGEGKQFAATSTMDSSWETSKLLPCGFDTLKSDEV